MRTTGWLVLGMCVFAPRPGFAQDPVAVNPAHHKVELDNADVRVLRITFEFGEKAPLHDHPNGVGVFLSSGVNRLTTPGQKADRDPAAARRRRAPGRQALSGEYRQEPTEMILVEMKKPG